MNLFKNVVPIFCNNKILVDRLIVDSCFFFCFFACLRIECYIQSLSGTPFKNYHLSAKILLWHQP